MFLLIQESDLRFKKEWFIYGGFRVCVILKFLIKYSWKIYVQNKEFEYLWKKFFISI